MRSHTENIITVLKVMNRNELKEFELFLKSPYYNSRTNVIALFAYLKRYAPQFTSKNYSKVNAFNFLYKSKKYNAGIINDAYSRLFRLSIKFLKLQKTETNIFSDIQILDTIREKQLDSIFVRMASRIESELAKMPDNRNNLINQFDSILAQYNYYVIQKTKTKAKNTERELSLAGDAIRKLILFFITNSTALLINTSFISSSFNKKNSDDLTFLFDSKIILQLISGIQWNNKEKVLVELYRKFFLVIESPKNKKYFTDYKKYIDKNILRLDKTEVLFHFHFLISQYRKNLMETNDIEYRLRMLALRESILFKELYISEFNREYLHLDFRNIIMDILNLQLPDHMQKLLPYVSKLPLKYQDSFHNYVIANYHFLQNDFKQAIGFANLISNVEKRLLIDADIMNIKIYFMNGEFIRCTDRINTLKKYLSTFKEMNVEARKRCAAFLTSINNSIHKIEKRDFDEFNFFKQELSKEKDFIFKDWLLAYLESPHISAIFPVRDIKKHT